MLILAFDTTSEVGGVGIFRGQECLARVANEDPANQYSISLFHMVEKVFEEAKARHGTPLRGLADIELIAVAAGPGSFTGIRIGLAAAQGWAKAFGMPVCGVSVLEALVEAAQTQADWAVPILNAHRGELFVGMYRRDPEGDNDCQSTYVSTAEGRLVRLEELGAILTRRLPEGAAVTCVVRGHDREAISLRENLPGRFQWQTVAGTLVEPVAHLGARDYGKTQAANNLDAFYIRRPDAEIYWKG